jgi:hypothetical protein
MKCKERVEETIVDDKGYEWPYYQQLCQDCRPNKNDRRVSHYYMSEYYKE